MDNTESTPARRPQCERYDPELLRSFAIALFARVGLPEDRAQVVADVLLEAELLGFSTHGFARLASNLEWLRSGATRSEGAPLVLQDFGSCMLWDANFLPGPWVVTQALRAATDRARTYGIGAVVVGRSQHAACLAAYLRRPAEQGLVVLVMASSPGEAMVAPHGGTGAVLSTNPIAAGFPTSVGPVLIDLSTSIVSAGQIARALADDRKLVAKALLTASGDVTDDPLVAVATPPGALLPVGGLSHGHKGFALGLLVEALSAGLSGYGRASDSAAEYGEANAVFLLVIDPRAFAGVCALRKEMDVLRARCLSSVPMPGTEGVRIPGERALKSRLEQLRYGVILHQAVVAELRALAARYNEPFPKARNHSQGGDATKL